MRLDMTPMPVMVNQSSVPPLSFGRIPEAIYTGLYNYVLAYKDGTLRQASVLTQLRTLCQVSAVDVFLVVLIAWLFTAVRLAITRTIIQPYADTIDVPERQRRKLPEIFLKLFYHTSAFTWGFLITYVARPQWIFDPPSMFEGWYQGAAAPLDIYALYVVQFGWYLHSLYATVALDVRTKDFSLLMTHHVLTMCLIALSHSTSMHHYGALTMMTHDVNDIFMLLWKATLVYKHQPKASPLWAKAADLFIAFFAISWFISRLVIYPATVIRGSFHDCWHLLHPSQMPVFWLAEAFMLLTLLCMDAYWFSFFPWGIFLYLYYGANEDYTVEDEVNDETSIVAKKQD